MKRIMILGAGVMQLPAFEAARRCGWQTVAVDGNPNAPALAQANRFLHIDLKDTDAIVAAARAEQRSAGLHAVFTVGTDFSVPVARVARELGLPGTAPEAAERASDKALMRRVLDEAGVAVPRFLEIGPNDAPDEIAANVERDAMMPVVVKPVDNMGARGVRRVNETGELAEIICLARNYSRTRRVIVEELIPGVEYSIDALVQDGEISITGVADRHVYFPPHFIELGHTLPAQLAPEELTRLEEGFCRGVRALGITDGAAKGDVFLTEDNVVIGEIAARLSGGYMSGWTYPLATGVSLVESGMRLAFGEKGVRLSPSREHTAAERAAISIPGVVRTVHGEEVARNVPGVTDLFLRCTPGDAVTMPRNNTEKVANAIAAAPERRDAVSAAERAVSSILVELEPAKDHTAAYLFGGDNAEFPDFFPGLMNEAAPESGAFDTVQTPAAELRGEIDRFRRSRLLPMPRVIATWPSHDGGGGGDGVTGGRASDGRGTAARDWNYRTVGRTMQLLMELRGLRPVEVSELPLIAALLVRCLSIGGAQGLLFAVDTMLEQPEAMQEYIRT